MTLRLDIDFHVRIYDPKLCQYIEVPVQVCFSKRIKSLRLSIDDFRGLLVLKLPVGFDICQGIRFIEKNMVWVTRSWLQYRDFHQQIPTLPFHRYRGDKNFDVEKVGDDYFFYHGRQQVLSIRRQDNLQGPMLCEHAQGLLLSITKEIRCLSCLYKALRVAAINLMQQTFTDYFKKWAERLECYPRKISIKMMKTRWGSCSQHGHISFNMALLCAPRSVCEYIVIHELCHLHHHDHGQDFWKMVKKHCPDYLDCAQWLQSNAWIIKYVLDFIH